MNEIKSNDASTSIAGSDGRAGVPHLQTLSQSGNGVVYPALSGKQWASEPLHQSPPPITCLSHSSMTCEWALFLGNPCNLVAIAKVLKTGSTSLDILYIFKKTIGSLNEGGLLFVKILFLILLMVLILHVVQFISRFFINNSNITAYYLTNYWYVCNKNLYLQIIAVFWSPFKRKYLIPLCILLLMWFSCN